MSYLQLTYLQRYQISWRIKDGYNQSAIARELGCHKSTISRELRRNAGKKGYRPKQAQELAFSRRWLSHPVRISQATWERVEMLIQLQWSPEQIHGRLQLEKQEAVSHEWIYQYIYADKERGGTLYRHLRSQKKQRKRYGGHARRAQIPNRITIDKRPKIVADNRRIGDLQVTAAVIAGVEVRRSVVAEHVDAGQCVAAAGDLEDAAASGIGSVGDDRASGVDMSEVNELAAVAAKPCHLARIGARYVQLQTAGPSGLKGEA